MSSTFLYWYLSFFSILLMLCKVDEIIGLCKKPEMKPLKWNHLRTIKRTFLWCCLEMILFKGVHETAKSQRPRDISISDYPDFCVRLLTRQCIITRQKPRLMKLPILISRKLTDALTLRWELKNWFAKLNLPSKNTLADNFPYSHHLPDLQCSGTVGRNCVLISFDKQKGSNHLDILDHVSHKGMYNYRQETYMIGKRQKRISGLCRGIKIARIFISVLHIQQLGSAISDNNRPLMLDFRAYGQHSQ